MTKIVRAPAPALVDPRKVKPQKKKQGKYGPKLAVRKVRHVKEPNIFKKWDMMYADILRKVKFDPELMDLKKNRRQNQTYSKTGFNVRVEKVSG